MTLAPNVVKGLSQAVFAFWDTRHQQLSRQADIGRSDQGTRGSVTGGKQMDGFVKLFGNSS